MFKKTFKKKTKQQEDEGVGLLGESAEEPDASQIEQPSEAKEPSTSVQPDQEKKPDGLAVPVKHARKTDNLSVYSEHARRPESLVVPSEYAKRPESVGVPDHASVADQEIKFHAGLNRFEPGKPIDVQIRIKVIQARQLVGGNIQPVVRVQVKEQLKQTRIKKSTTNPWWDESFFFNFKISPSDLKNEQVVFSVYNSRTLRSDALLGSFKCDVGVIYNEPYHAFVNKWILLSDPDETTLCSKGYLKISACVLGPGDVAPNMDTKQNVDDEDIESNLLMPVGMQLRPAKFSLYLYQAEDIPTMDSDFLGKMKNIFESGETQKALVDPYFVFSFAGKEVTSKIIYRNDQPQWYQILQLGLQFPSMCERIKLQIRDWDFGGTDDCVATTYLLVSLLSALGDNGFLPTFGPCYVNMYGATREFSDKQSIFEDLNLGKIEGVAYRGRALIQLKTTLDELPDNPVEDMLDEHKVHVEKFMRTRKYRVIAAFSSVNLISPSLADGPVQFELSMGNYGNILDESVLPCPSTTKPTYPVFDGCYYYFLPWANVKSCVVVDSSWEDISFRLESLNMILNIEERLTRSLKQLRIGMKAKRPVPELAQVFVSMLNQLIIDCDTPLSPAKDYHASNELDVLKEKLRKVTLQTLKTAAITLRDTATDLNEAVIKVEEFLDTIKNVEAEPQNSMPDVVLWMIVSQKRIAYYRIPAYELLYSDDEEMKGTNCGRNMSLAMKYPYVEGKNRKSELPAIVTLKLWLGLLTESNSWRQMQDGELTVCAETYENQVNILGSWTNKGPTLARPKWSDSEGKIELKKEEVVPPSDWQWNGDWYVSPEASMLLDKEEAYATYVEEIYECFTRDVPGGSWRPATQAWTDMKGESATERTEILLPEGWTWDYDWQIDLNRAVDEEGWEYCVDAALGGYGPVEKTFHLHRRRRWLRARTYIQDVSKTREKQEEKLIEGWEYAPLFNMKFHPKRRTADLVRRRRWHRKMICLGVGESYYLRVQKKGSVGTEEEPVATTTSLAVPRVFLTFRSSHDYQLRAYIYQARDLIAADDSGLSDPLARVAYLNHSMVTEKQKKTLTPTWDQTLIFEDIKLYDDPEVVEDSPPEIYIELFDHDIFGKSEFLGRAKAQPMVKLDSCDPRTPVLQWYSIQRFDQDGGELLAAFELIMVTEKAMPFLPPKVGDLYCIPTGIRPVMQRTGIEILCWGVRNMKKFNLAEVSSPSVRFTCGGYVQDSATIKNTRKHPNFPEKLLFFDVMLPREELYMPPVTITVRDRRQFGRNPTVGVHVLKFVEMLRIDQLSMGGVTASSSFHSGEIWDLPPVRRGSETVINITVVETNEKESSLTKQELDWWGKYYASTKDIEKCRKYHLLKYDTLEVLAGELEKSHNHKGFTDFCQTLPLYMGKQKQNEDGNIVGEFKGAFCMYPLPADPDEPLPPRVFQNLPGGDIEECVVRVYIIKASDLQPCDPNGLADPYIEIELGKQKIDSRDEYVPNCINPTFGRMFELKAPIPIYKDLVIRVKDYDLLSFDDTVGETTIDLENRYLTKYRATCGLPKSYCESGVNKWRDNQKPLDILDEYCKRNNLEKPVFINKTTVNIGNRQYKLSDFENNKPTSKHWGPENQRLALHILNLTPLVKEHVESRALFNQLQPSIEQGRLHMWIDIFPKSRGPPDLPFDISPRKPSKFVLCCVIWNTVDVILEDLSVTGQRMSDIYVQGWMEGIDEKQKTDIHYRSLNGEGNFNWRFVFPFEYLPSEQTMTVRKKEHFWSLDETEFRKAPKFIVQIWDNDKFSADDFIGQLELNLSAMPMPVKTSKKCQLTMLPEVGRNVMLASLFEMKHMCGFWPCYDESSGTRRLTGKVEMELQLLTAAEFEEKPAGLGRDEPNMHPKLDPPKRPDTSFLWLTSPWKVAKYVVWHNYRGFVIKVLIGMPLLTLVMLFIYSLPGQFSAWLINTH